MKQTYTFDYCALRYLDHWLGVDWHFHRGMVSSDRSARLKAAVDIAIEYSVIRSLKLSVDAERGKERLEDVIDAIDEVDRFPKTDFVVPDPVILVDQVSMKLQGAYGTRLLSFSSKLLWFRFRSPIVIYDRNARVALKRRKCDLADGDYAGFCRCWHEQYAISRVAISSACERLSEVFTYSEFSSDEERREEMLRVVRKDWFLERVFDQLLWLEGR